MIVSNDKQHKFLKGVNHMTTSNLNPKVTAIIQATVTVATIDQIVERTGFQRNSILALINTIKKEGLGAYDKETKTLTLSPEGIATLTPIVDEVVEEDVVDVETDVLSPEMIAELTATPQLQNDIVDVPVKDIIKPNVTAASKLADGTKPTGTKGRAKDGTSKRAQFEAYMTANPGMSRGAYIKVAIAQFGLTDQGAGTYIYNFNKVQKAAGKPLISQQTATPPAKVVIPTSWVQPTVQVVVTTTAPNMEVKSSPTV